MSTLPTSIFYIDKDDPHGRDSNPIEGYWAFEEARARAHALNTAEHDSYCYYVRELKMRPSPEDSL